MLQSKSNITNSFSLGKNNEEILSDGSDVEGKNTDENRDYIGSDGVHSDESEDETTEEKRLRLAKKYLEEIERQGMTISCFGNYINSPKHLRTSRYL